MLAVELGPRVQRAAAVCPGYVLTDMVPKGIDEGWLKEPWRLERVPAGRFGAVREVVAVVRYLASQEAACVNGRYVIIDGGWTSNGVGGIPDWLEHRQ